MQIADSCICTTWHKPRPSSPRGGTKRKIEFAVGRQWHWLASFTHFGVNWRGATSSPTPSRTDLFWPATFLLTQSLRWSGWSAEKVRRLTSTFLTTDNANQLTIYSQRQDNILLYSLWRTCQCHDTNLVSVIITYMFNYTNNSTHYRDKIEENRSMIV